MNTYLPTANATPLSLHERDRRYGSVREALNRRDLKAVLVTGSNLFYLSNGIPWEMFGVLSADEHQPFVDILTWRALADISAEEVRQAQEWVTDIRSGRDGMAVVACLRDLGLDHGKIGYAGSLDQGIFGQIVRELPAVALENATDMFVDLRTIKSDEETALIERANVIFDRAIDAIRANAHAGMRGRDVVQLGRVAMWDAGGDLDSDFGFNCGPVGSQSPVLGEFGLERRIEPGDIGTLTAHSHYLGYSGHSDQEIAFGTARPLHVDMFEAVIHVRREILRLVRAGVTHRELVDAYERATAETGFWTSKHSQMHLYGIDIPEFPGPAFKIADSKRGEGLGGSGNFVLQPGMIFSISPTLVNAKTGDSLLGGTSLVVTENGYANLGNRAVELLVAP